MIAYAVTESDTLHSTEPPPVPAPPRGAPTNRWAETGRWILVSSTWQMHIALENRGYTVGRFVWTWRWEI